LIQTLAIWSEEEFSRGIVMPGRGMRHGMGMARGGRQRQQKYFGRSSGIPSVGGYFIVGLQRMGVLLLDKLGSQTARIPKITPSPKLESTGNNLFIGTTEKQIGIAGKLRAVINYDQCLNCGVCMPACPLGAIITVDKVPTINQDICNGCGRCQVKCPVDAISITKI